jgi:uncharacterized protein
MPATPLTAEIEAKRRYKFVAPKWHTVALLAFFFVYLGVGFLLQHKSTTRAVAPSSPFTRVSLVPSLLESLAFDWGVFFFAWFGVRQKGGNLATLSAGRWTRARDVLRDIALAIPFWVIWEMVAHLPDIVHQRRNVVGTLWNGPQGFLEVSLWLLLSCSAGFCEEFVYRGYFLQQFSAFTKSIWLSVLAQGVVFALTHSFRSWGFVLLLTILGVLYALFALLRKDLKPVMIAHAMTDIWEGWLKHILNFSY